MQHESEGTINRIKMPSDESKARQSQPISMKETVSGQLILTQGGATESEFELAGNNGIKTFSYKRKCPVLQFSTINPSMIISMQKHASSLLSENKP